MRKLLSVVGLGLVACSAGGCSAARQPAPASELARPELKRFELACERSGSGDLPVFAGGTNLKDVLIWYVKRACRPVVGGKRALEARLSAQTTPPGSAGELESWLRDLVVKAGQSPAFVGDTLLILDGSATVIAYAPQRTKLSADEPTELEVARRLDEGITQTAEGSYSVRRGIWDLVLANPALIGRAARIVPTIKDGKPSGFKLYAIRPGSFFSRLGFQNGDAIEKVNGYELTSPDKALEIYSQVRAVSELKVQISRGGKPILLTYRIVDEPAP
jgi:hypothetical protein